jgi:serine protease
MKKFFFLFMIAVLALNVSAQKIFPGYQDGKIWFKLKADYRVEASLQENPDNLQLASLPFLNAICKDHSVKNLSRPFHAAKKSGTLDRIYLLEINDAQNISAVIDALKASGKTEYAEKVPLDKILITPNDPSYGSQWALPKISATLAWNYFSTGSTIVVGIVDDGLERTHPDLSPSLWVNPGETASNGIDDDGNGYIDDVNGWDIADNDNNPNPTTLSYDHGTHVAGIVGAKSNNGIGVASIGYSVKLMAVKSTNSPGVITNGYEGIIYAVDNGANVINCSWGGYSSSVTAQAIIDYAYNAGVVVVAAAGNDNISTILYPAGYTHVISVAASSSNDAKAGFSNYGAWVDITAPGENIYSTTVGASYGNKSGTSMASPMVAGLAALMLSLNHYLTPDDIENCIKSNATNIDAMNPSYIGQLGAGRINANLSMSCVNASLSWVPVANFSANFTTVTAGGSVHFTNLTQYAYPVTTYSWSFPGGTPSSSTLQSPPNITYATPGTYNVTLTVTNSHGTDSEIKSSYITVNAASGCTKINFPPPSGWTPVNYYTGATVGQDGWINGMNVYLDKEKAMYFDASASPYTKLTNVWIAFGLAYSATPSKIVPIKIYDGTSGSPGAQIGTTVNTTMGRIMSDVDGNYYTEIDFTNTPVTLPASKKFFVSVDLTNLQWVAGTHDTLSIVSNSNGQTSPSAIWEKQSDNIWYQYTTAGSWNLSASLYIHPWLTDEVSVATFTQNQTTVCAGSVINFDATGSTYQDTLLWWFQGGSPLISNNLVQSVNYNTAGNYEAILYVIGGGCSQFDSAFVNITVNANPTISINATATTLCSGNSATLTASGANSYIWTPPTGLNVTTGPVVITTPTASTLYNVMGTAANGCTNNSTIQIMVQPPPVATLSNPSPVVCQGAPFSYDGSLSTDANIFAWSFSGASPASSSTPLGTTIFNTAGNQSVQLIVSNLCGADTSSQSITVNALPVAAFSGPTSACVTDNVIFDASTSTAATTYAWTFQSGTPATSTQMIDSTVWNVAGTYTVMLITTNSCASDTSTSNIVIGCVNMDENNTANIRMFLDQPDQQFVLQFPDNAIEGKYQLVLYSGLGQVLSLSDIDVSGGQHRFILDVNQLAAGMYIIRLSGNGTNAVQKFVKQLY